MSLCRDSRLGLWLDCCRLTTNVMYMQVYRLHVMVCQIQPFSHFHVKKSPMQSVGLYRSPFTSWCDPECALYTVTMKIILYFLQNSLNNVRNVTIHTAASVVRSISIHSKLYGPRNECRIRLLIKFNNPSMQLATYLLTCTMTWWIQRLHLDSVHHNNSVEHN